MIVARHLEGYNMSWIDEEFRESHFSDQRLGERLCKLVTQLFDKMGHRIPAACQDWGSTKAAYRFFSNPNLSEEEIEKSGGRTDPIAWRLVTNLPDKDLDDAIEKLQWSALR
jgi:hypothetical protein